MRINEILLFCIIALMVLPSAITATEEPVFAGCEMCHADIAKNFSTSLHYQAYGMMGEYEEGAAGYHGIDMDEYYEEWNCGKCHVSTCTVCHEDGHNAEITLDTCDPCHFKKQTSTFIGDMPMHKSEGPSADIHYEKGMICIDCHSAEEMHGDGIIYSNQMQAVKVTCEDCHRTPGTIVEDMSVTQYSLEIPAHEIHDETLDCKACHTGWQLTCNNCHLDTRTGTQPVFDEFYLGVASDGKITTFMKMDATYDNEMHTGYGEWFSHTITDKPKDCAFCHENREVLCEGCEGQMLGDGGSFIPQTTIDRIIGAHITPTPTPTEVPDTPGFGFMVAFAGLLSAVLLFKRQ